MKADSLTNKKGFTIAEMLIIVAIVGVLVAVSIPLFTAQLEKARETVDIHTMRTAASLGQQFYYEGVTGPESARKAGMKWYKQSGSDTNVGSNAYAIYIPEKGVFSDKDYDDLVGELSPYGKGGKLDGGVSMDGADGKLAYDPKLDYTKAVCQVSIFPNGNNKRVEVAWKELKKGSRPFIGNTTGNNYPRLTIYMN